MDRQPTTVRFNSEFKFGFNLYDRKTKREQDLQLLNAATSAPAFCLLMSSLFVAVFPGGPGLAILEFERHVSDLREV